MIYGLDGNIHYGIDLFGGSNNKNKVSCVDKWEQSSILASDLIVEFTKLDEKPDEFIQEYNTRFFKKDVNRHIDFIKSQGYTREVIYSDYDLIIVKFTKK